MKALIAMLLVTFSGAALAADDSDIPLTEHEFVDRIKTVDKSQILAQLGEPARAVDVKDDATGEVMGSIWHYNYLNTGENGDYYKTTELDFVGDKVVTVVFSTVEDDGDDAAPDEQTRPDLSRPNDF